METEKSGIVMGEVKIEKDFVMDEKVFKGIITDFLNRFSASDLLPGKPFKDDIDFYITKNKNDVKLGVSGRKEMCEKSGGEQRGVFVYLRGYNNFKNYDLEAGLYNTVRDSSLFISFYVNNFSSLREIDENIKRDVQKSF